MTGSSGRHGHGHPMGELGPWSGPWSVVRPRVPWSVVLPRGPSSVPVVHGPCPCSVVRTRAPWSSSAQKNPGNEMQSVPSFEITRHLL